MIAKVNGNTMTITSAVKVEEFEKLGKSNPDALRLYEEKGEKKVPVFQVGAALHGVPAASSAGVIFNGKTYDGGYATITIPLPVFETAEQAKEFVAEKYGLLLKRLSAWEQTVPGVLDEIDRDHAAVLEMIQF